MISALVFLLDRQDGAPDRRSEVLVRSLAWLVSAVVAGTVREVTIAGPRADGLSAVADECGCSLAEGDTEAERLAAGIAATREAWLLVLRSGYQPSTDFIGELDSFLRAPEPGRVTRLLARPATFWQRLLPDRAETVGLLAPAARCRALAGGDFRRMTARLKPSTRFVARAVPIA